MSDMQLATRKMQIKPTNRQSPTRLAVRVGSSRDGARQVANRSREEGITLLIAIVILSSVLFITFSLSSVILREIGAARATLQTEPAISGSDAGSEVGIYAVVRNTGAFTGTQTLAQSGVEYEYETDHFRSPFYFSIDVGQIRRFQIYNPNDPFPVSPDNDFHSVTLSGVSATAQMLVYYSSEPPEEGGLPFCGGPVSSPSGSLTCILDNPLNGDDRYWVEVIPLGGLAMTGALDTTDNAGQPKGMPAPPVLDVTGTLGDVQRKIRVDLGSNP